MAPEVQERIAQLRRGELPNGYKRGKLGIVPMEWDDVPFSSLFISTSDYTDDLETYPLYSLTIEDGITAKTERYNRSHLVKKSESYKIVRPNDFAYNPMNIRLGAVARHKGSFPVAVSGYYDIFTTVAPGDLAFMDSFLTCAPMITYYNKVSTGSLLEKQRVHFSQFLEFSLPLPPLEERKKIGAILSAQDRVIELKKRLISAKQQQKNHLMQQFLTGRQRLPGFSGAWEYKPLGAVTTNLEEKAGTGKYEVLSISANVGFVSQREKFGREIAGKQYCNYTVLKKGDFSYNKGNSNRYPQGCIYLLEDWENAVVPNVFISFRMHQICYPPYYKFLFESGYLNAQLFRLVNFGVRNDGLLNLNNGDFYSCVIPIPPYDEQLKIASVFQTATDELGLLRKSLEQEKRKKKALSQLLLTGIVRV